MSTLPDAVCLPLKEIPNAVEQALVQFFDERRESLVRIGAPVTEAAGHVESFVLGGGKRLRPLFAWAGFLGAGGLAGPEDAQAVLRAVSSLELIQACALIHDDIIDSSDTRRGSPTVHRRVESLHRERAQLGDSVHFGESVAILAGDLALVWAEDMLIDAGLSADALKRARPAWRGMRTEVIGGQMLDIYLEASGSEDIDAAQSVNRFKTAAYTIERPLHLGATIAGAPEHLITAFRGYGHDIGIAFQLRDDLLGVFGDSEITGKPAGDDLREGKRTVLLAEALRRADIDKPADAQLLRNKVGQTNDPEEIAQLAAIIAATGAPEAVEERIRSLQKSGLEFLAQAGVDEEVTETLHQLALQATERRR